MSKNLKTSKPKKDFMGGYKTYDTSNGFGSAKEWRSSFSERMSKEEAQEVINGQRETPYSILGISATATKDEIKKAYRKLIMQWHEDRNPNNTEEAKAMSRKIIAAYSLLN